jgi:1-deoxy-D-xylulose-5-phosphate synthase
MLKKEGIKACVVNARVLKPLDGSLLSDMASRINKWITLEDSLIQGGFGSSINEFVNMYGLLLRY